MSASPPRGLPVVIIVASALTAAGTGALAMAMALEVTPRTLVLIALGAHLPFAWLAARLLTGPAIAAPRAWLLLAALLLRLPLAVAPPVLSDDVHRYVWDGRVLLAGHNPFAHAPDAPALAALRDRGWSRINHPELRTMYPPGAAVLHAGLAAVSTSTVWFKLAAALADLAVVLLLLGLAGQSLAWLWALFPFAAIESAGSGHLDFAALALTLGAVLAGRRDRPHLAGGLLGAATALKLAPALLLPFLVRERGWRVLVAFAAVIGVIALPFLGAGEGLVATMDTYLRRWAGNAGLFALLERAAGAAIAAVSGAATPETLVHLPWLDALAGAVQGTFFSLHKDGGFDAERPGAFAVADLALAAAKLSSLLAGAALALHLWRRRVRVEAAAAWLFGALIVLAPIVHPWYAAWAAALGLVTGVWPFLVFAALSPLAYLPLAGWWERGVWEAPGWIAALEHGGLGIALGWWCWRRRRTATENPPAHGDLGCGGQDRPL